MRPKQLWIYITIYVSVVVLLLYINYTGYKYQQMYNDNMEKLSVSLCYQFLILQALLLWIWGAYNSGSAITNEITGNSYDFFRMLPLSAGKKAVGILVGKNLIVILISCINFILTIAFGLYGQKNASWLGQTFLSLISVAILINSVALLSSIKPVGKKKKSNIAAIILILFFLGPFLIRLVVSATNIRIFQNATGSFYNFELPIMILTSLIALYFACWSIKGVLRKFTLEEEPLFNRIGAFLFMLGYEFVLFGLFYEYLTEGARRINYSYWLISLLPVLAVPFGSLRKFDKYLEHSGIIRSRKKENQNIMSRMYLYSNLSLGLGLFVIWAGCSIATTLITELELLPHLYMILVLFSSYLFLLLLLELYVVFMPVSNKIGTLLVFIAAVYIILPLIISGLLDSEVIYMHSPVGFIWKIFQKSYPDISIQTSIWALNLLLCIIPALLIWKRHLYILSTRRKM
jgi:hypothetical protein